MMTGKLKALGLALIAMLAISAIVAAAAQAEEGTFTLEGEQGFIHATREQPLSSPVDYFQTASGNKLACESIHYSSGTLTGNSNKVTITPDYTDHTQGSNCKMDNVLKVTITENGCAFVFYHLTTVAGKTDYTTTVEIECPAGKALETHVHKLLSSEIACTTTIKSQTLNGTLTVENMAGLEGHPTDLTLSGSINIPSIQHNKESTLCGGAKNETLEPVYTYVISSPLTVTGTNDAKNVNKGLDVSHP
jgi:hypothetical protein